MINQAQSKSLQILYWLLVAGTASNAAGAEDEQALQVPDLELLEFLGSFQTDNGEWIEPESLLTGEFAELLNIAASLDAATGDSNANDDNEVSDQGNDQ